MLEHFLYLFVLTEEARVGHFRNSFTRHERYMFFHAGEDTYINKNTVQYTTDHPSFLNY